jgi:hypothetical protein
MFPMEANRRDDLALVDPFLVSLSLTPTHTKKNSSSPQEGLPRDPVR